MDSDGILGHDLQDVEWGLYVEQVCVGLESVPRRSQSSKVAKH